MLLPIQVVLQHHSHIPVDRLPEWMNAVGLLVSNLPEPYWHGLHAKLERMLASSALTHWPHPALTPTQLFDFNEVHALKTDTSLAYLMATAHATWHHAGFNQLCGILDVGEFGLGPPNFLHFLNFFSQCQVFYIYKNTKTLYIFLLFHC
jgi:hypothetical protein